MFPTDSPEAGTVEAFVNDSALALKRTSLQYTRVLNGWFMDYWGMPHIPSDLSPFVWGLDIANRRAAIPGKGDDILTLTYSVDVARIVVRLLDLEEWPEFSIVSGSDASFNEMLTIAQRARGVPFDVVYDSQGKLENMEPTILFDEGYGPLGTEEMKHVTASSGLMLLSGRLQVPTENRLKFSDITLTTVEDLITQAWTGK